MQSSKEAALRVMSQKEYDGKQHLMADADFISWINNAGYLDMFHGDMREAMKKKALGV